MFGRKKQRWLAEARITDTPLPLRKLASPEETSIIASFFREKIGLRELNGIVSPDDEAFIPSVFIERYISQELSTRGILDICDLIDATNLPGEILENQIRLYVKNVDGFFDLINRKFFTPFGAISEVKQLIGMSLASDLTFLLNKLYWSDDHFESILELMTQKDFVGYINPIKNRLYNFTTLDFSSKANEEKNFKYLMRFIATSFDLESEVSLKDISSLTKLTEEDALDLLDRNRNKENYVFSKDFYHIYPTIDIITQILKDIFVYHEIPIEFWLDRLDVNRADFSNLLTILNGSLNGKITSEDFKAPLLKNWFKKGIDIEGLVVKLNLKSKDLLDRILNLSQLLQLKLVAGDSADPFLVKGVENFDIFCQVDTSSYTDPHLYFECQNCRRIMCSNCRSAGSKHECPFCKNISAFIIDLPRHCEHCKINYTHSYNLVSAEECHFCKKGPLKDGWIETETILLKKTEEEHKLRKFLKNSSDTEIPIRNIISLMNYSDTKTITLLENYILHGIIHGRINIRKMKLQLVRKKKQFKCIVCELQRTNLEGFSCNTCKNKVCVDCFNEMKVTGMTLCPECGGTLTLKKD
ncbi:MAG: hypothetical protein ACXAC8_00285 [Candidatus Hodarchaeales archaeon]|jgi:hypothetical protein